MAGTTGLEPATSAVTEIAQNIRTCGLSCGLGKSGQRPEFLLRQVERQRAHPQRSLVQYFIALFCD